MFPKCKSYQNGVYYKIISLKGIWFNEEVGLSWANVSICPSQCQLQLQNHRQSWLAKLKNVPVQMDLAIPVGKYNLLGVICSSGPCPSGHWCCRERNYVSVWNLGKAVIIVMPFKRHASCLEIYLTKLSKTGLNKNKPCWRTRLSFL